MVFSGNSRGRCRKPSCPRGRIAWGPMLPDSLWVTQPQGRGRYGHAMRWHCSHHLIDLPQCPAKASPGCREPLGTRGGRWVARSGQHPRPPQEHFQWDSKVHHQHLPCSSWYEFFLNPEMRLTELFLKLKTPSIFTFSLSHFLDKLWHIKIYIFFHSKLFHLL